MVADGRKPMPTTEHRFYKTPDGTKYPLYEAPYKYSITVYKSDRGKAQVGDPHACLIALGARRDKMVQDVFIGSGKDAYLIFKGHRHQKAYALHFTIGAEAARVRDWFDAHKDAKTMTIELSVPSKGRTLEHRAKIKRDRREAIKNGAEVASRDCNSGKAAKVTRVMRLGVKHRPRALIEKDGVVTVPPKVAEPAE